EWRKEWEVDSILTWKAPEVLIKYYPVGFSGYDKDGFPVWIIPYGRGDMRGLLHSCQKRDYIRYTIQVLEQSLEDMRDKSKKWGRPINRQSCIFDLENFSIKNVTWKPAMDVILQLVQIYEVNYPEILKHALVINAPKIFTAAYALIKPFMDEVTMSKVRIFGRTGWQEALLEIMDPDQLPAHWGGSMRDPDGNPKCPSKVRFVFGHSNFRG
ncbi:UNVERIFIED_CONTAM: hypothetical protein GTU68_044313, partial [Idotea baltica]|nr:hypothetical protein [Idotea baltica]